MAISAQTGHSCREMGQILPQPQESHPRWQRGGAGGTDPDGCTPEHWWTSAQLPCRDLLPGKADAAVCEEGVRSWWEPTWDDAEWEHRRGLGCGWGDEAIQGFSEWKKGGNGLL